MCQTFESGKMVPDPKRGGNVEFSYVKDAIKLVNFQARRFKANDVISNHIIVLGIFFQCSRFCDAVFSHCLFDWGE